MRIILSITVVMFAFAPAARADIFQWEYINPGDPSQGKQQSTTLVPEGAGVDAVPGADLSGRDLTMAYLIGANLTNANLGSRITDQGIIYCEYCFPSNWLNVISFRGASLTA